MLTLFIVGFVVGVIAVIGVIRLTMRTEPTTCLITFGTMFLLTLLLLVVGTQWVLAK